ncbi:hypothetical protein NPIL_267831 [Nephila pilipes]|uniref:Uncharacterized protein n=1 Tax=Nephila pilipes TaxID=299642 RepID=A0A8X6MQ20_NEPPI|nr:hypothetical protein NPIL_267831 [Nephila pilipes]
MLSKQTVSFYIALVKVVKTFVIIKTHHKQIYSVVFLYFLAYFNFYKKYFDGKIANDAYTSEHSLLIFCISAYLIILDLEVKECVFSMKCLHGA